MLIFDSEAWPEGDRAEVLNAAFTSAETPQSVRFNAEGPVHHRMEIFKFGPGVHMLRNTGTALHVVRNSRHVRLGTCEEMAVFVQTRGQGLLATGDGVSLQQPGQIGAVDVTRPYALRQIGDSESNVLLISFDQLGVPVDTIRAAIPALQASPIYRLLQGHLPGLAVDLPASPATMTGQATAELITALVTTVSGGREHRC